MSLFFATFTELALTWRKPTHRVPTVSLIDLSIFGRNLPTTTPSPMNARVFTRWESTVVKWRTGARRKTQILAHKPTQTARIQACPLGPVADSQWLPPSAKYSFDNVAAASGVLSNRREGRRRQLQLGSVVLCYARWCMVVARTKGG